MDGGEYDMVNKHKIDEMPGSLSFKERIEQMIRVDQAGEYGAKRIYEGQMAVLKNDACIDTLKHMADQEAEHLAFFNQQVSKRHIRPTIFQPIWHVAGFALGAGTALMGKKAAMACTVAIEETIDEHYQEQLQELEQIPDADPELAKKIEQFRQEELEHRDIGLEHDAEKTPGYDFLYQAVRAGSKLAIWLSKRF